LELNGKDLRALPSERKAKLEKLLARAPAALIFNEHTAEDGAVVFRHHDEPGRKRSYRSGPSRDWIKVKNPDSAAMRRARAGTW
jgi:ATP-dependent DNA ligase